MGGGDGGRTATVATRTETEGLELGLSDLKLANLGLQLLILTGWKMNAIFCSFISVPACSA